jgi:hypothetical protein
MKPIKLLTSACRYCHYYKPEGRRGGVCNQLGAPVQGSWKACSLALPPFAPSWENLEDAWSFPDTTALASTLKNSELTNIEQTASCSSQEQVEPELQVMLI